MVTREQVESDIKTFEQKIQEFSQQILMHRGAILYARTLLAKLPVSEPVSPLNMDKFDESQVSNAQES